MATETATLATMITDLDGYIQRRAGEIAAERIEAAEDAASDRVAALVAEANENLAECQAARRRAEDVLAEVRRRIVPLERQAGQNRAAAGKLAAALGHHPLGHYLPGLVDEAIEVMGMGETVAALTGKGGADGN
jgi:hypothetical protein